MVVAALFACHLVTGCKLDTSTPSGWQTPGPRSSAALFTPNDLVEACGAQTYVLKGEFIIDGKVCTPGTMLFHPDPPFEGEFRTETGGDILIVQYPGPTTGERPIYAGRFNMTERKSVSAERVDL